MIQRIQTLYLALAVILLVLCCGLPLAGFEPQGMGLPHTMYSIVLLNADHAIENYCPITLLVIAACIELACIAAVVGYKNRRRQMKTCLVAMAFQVLWIANYAIYAFTLVPETTFRPRLAAALPAVALVLTWLARRAIKKDDDLVRSVDRIR